MTNLERQMPGMLDGLIAVARRDLLLAWKRPGDVLNPLFFFAMVCTLFPLAVGPSAEQLTFSGPGVLWVAALLAMLISLNSLFISDFDDGSLEQLLVSPQPLPLVVNMPELVQQEPPSEVWADSAGAKTVARRSVQSLVVFIAGGKCMSLKNTG